MGFSGLTGAASAAQGAFGLFAGENENLHKIMLKVQSLMAITIGLQQVQATLNKDSAFMIVTVTKAKDMLAAAELRFATALGISNVAAKALMATLTLGLSVAIGVAIAAITVSFRSLRKPRRLLRSSTPPRLMQPINPLLGLNACGRSGPVRVMTCGQRISKLKTTKMHLRMGVQVKGVADAENI